MARWLNDRLAEALGDRYVLEQEVGRGGMAKVFVARDLRHGRRVAIKVIGEDVTTPVFAERFLDEIRIAARLNHPHVLPVHDSGEAAGSLYYVMPFVEGGTLRNLLEREGPLEVDRACRLVAQIADALEYAHRSGIVHRDVKPDNIFLTTPQHAVLADFGIARALTLLEQHLTMQGAFVGSPLYMSPEQAAGAVDLDGRSDVYSLGCVLYELLSGEPPFRGESVQSILSAHLTVQPRPLRSLRADVPEFVARTVHRALAKQRDERIASGADLRQALEGHHKAARLTRRSGWFAFGGSAAAVAVALLARGGLPLPQPGAPPDTTRYAVLPFSRTSDVTEDLNEQWLLYDALSEWSGIKVVAPLQVNSQLPPADSRMTARDAAARIRHLSAGRIVGGDLRRVGDSIRVTAMLFDTGNPDQPLRVVGAHLPLDQRLVWDSVARSLADSLLFPGATSAFARERVHGTSSRPARLAFDRGRSLLLEWRLREAENRFLEAIRFDPDYAQAHLWIAQVRAWRGDSRGEWSVHAQRANALRERLPELERGLAAALVYLSDGDYAMTCSEYAQLIRRDSMNFVSWYGRAECLRRDPRIVPDKGVPGRYTFLTSAEEAVDAYRRAFALLPAMHRIFRDQSFSYLRLALFTSTQAARRGQDAMGNTYMAFPALEAGTLAFYAHPLEDFTAGSDRIVAATRRQAVGRQTQIFLELATGWARGYPESSSALLALAIAQELSGDPAAIDAIRRARASGDESETIDLAAAHVWLLVKFGLPDREDLLAQAFALADSLLTRAGEHAPTDARRLAGVAALLGRPAAAGRLLASSMERASIPGLPLEVERDAARLSVFAAMGGPTDSISAIEDRVEGALQRFLPGKERAMASYALLGRAASLAFDQHDFHLVQDGDLRSDFLLLAVRNLSAEDTTTIRREVERWRIRNERIEGSIDGALSEALLLDHLGRNDLVEAWLEPSLSGLVWSPPLMIDDPVWTAALVRASHVLARNLLQQGDSAAAVRWARPVAILWQEPEPYIERLIAHLPGRQPAEN